MAAHLLGVRHHHHYPHQHRTLMTDSAVGRMMQFSDVAVGVVGAKLLSGPGTLKAGVMCVRSERLPIWGKSRPRSIGETLIR